MISFDIFRIWVGGYSTRECHIVCGASYHVWDLPSAIICDDVVKDPGDRLSPLTSAKSYNSKSRYSARYFPANIPSPMTQIGIILIKKECAPQFTLHKHPLWLLIPFFLHPQFLPHPFLHEHPFPFLTWLTDPISFLWFYFEYEILRWSVKLYLPSKTKLCTDWRASSIGHVSCALALTRIPQWVHICAHLNYYLRDSLITFPIFVRWQRLIARNDCELFSSNRGISHFNEACRIDELSRGSVLGYEILTNN